MASFKSKVSPHILKARKMYKINNIIPSKKLAKATKCSIKGLRRMVRKVKVRIIQVVVAQIKLVIRGGYARMRVQ